MMRIDIMIFKDSGKLDRKETIFPGTSENLKVFETDKITKIVKTHFPNVGLKVVEVHDEKGKRYSYNCFLIR